MGDVDLLKILTESREAMNDLCDVEFQAKDRDGIMQSFRAHKNILGTLSPVFKQMFFGTLSRSAKNSGNHICIEIDVVKIEDFKADTIKNYLDILYGNKQIMQRCHFVDLFKIMKLSDKYETSTLTTLLLKALSDRRITNNNVLSVLVVAFQHRNLLNFEELCNKLLKKCAEFLHLDMKSFQDVYKLHSELQICPDLADLVFKQLSLMEEPSKLEVGIKNLAAENVNLKLNLLSLERKMSVICCSNCGYKYDQCKDDKSVNVKQKELLGTKVRENTMESYKGVITKFKSVSFWGAANNSYGRVWFYDGNTREFMDLSVLNYACK